MSPSKKRKLSEKDKSVRDQDNEDYFTTLADDLLYQVMHCCDRHSLRVLHEVSQRMRWFSLNEITHKSRKSAELRLVHTTDRQSFLLRNEESNDCSFFYTIDLSQIDLNLMLSPKRKVAMNESKRRIYGELDKECKAIQSIEKNHAPSFTDQFNMNLRKILERNSFRILRFVNVLIDVSFFSGVGRTVYATEVELMFDGVSMFEFTKEDYKRFSDWILSMKPTKILEKKCIGFSKNIFQLDFVISFAKLHDSVHLIFESVVKKSDLFNFPHEQLKYLCNFVELRLYSILLDTDHLFELLDMRLHSKSSCKGHWCFLITRDIQLDQIDVETNCFEYFKDTKITDNPDTQNDYVAESTIKKTNATFSIRRMGEYFGIEVNFYDK